MREKVQVSSLWLRKVAFCLAFFSILSVKNAAAYGLPPVITVPPLGVTVQTGDTITLTTTVGVSLTPVTVKWYLNGNSVNSIKSAVVVTASVPADGTTLSTLTITNATTAQAGNYYVVVQNSGGSVTSGNAPVIVLAPSAPPGVSLLPSQCEKTNGGFHLGLLKPAQSNCVLEASTDFINWTPIYTNTSSSTNFSYLDSAATNLLSRYYRARLQ